MRGFISVSSKKATIYTEEIEEERGHFDRIYKSISVTSLADLRIDHDLREKAVIKFIENAKIVGFSEGSRQDIEIDFENGDKLKKLENILQVKLVNIEVKTVLKDYVEGEITLEDAFSKLLPYVVARKLIKT